MTSPEQAFEPQPYPNLVKLNLAIGPDCPIRCEGCYNVFAGPDDELVTADDVIGFAAAASEAIDVDQITLSGGDPLHHPEVVDIVQGVRPFTSFLQMDTVGTALLADTPVLYKGRSRGAAIPRIAIDQVADSLDLVSLPLDEGGSRSLAFRKGRANLFEETIDAVDLLKEAHVPVGFNTVVTAANIGNLLLLREVAEQMRIDTWQLYQFDPYGPNPSKKQAALQVGNEEFRAATERIESEILVEGYAVLSPWITVKSLQERLGSYIMIGANGIAQRESLIQVREGFAKRYDTIGHIVRDEGVVLNAIVNHARHTPASYAAV